MLNSKQQKLIELLITEEYSISEACKVVGINRASYYDWKQGTGKTAKEFQKAYDEALNLKVQESRERVRNNVNGLLDSLTNIAKKGGNENARVNAVGKLINYAELDPADKQDITVNENKDKANELLHMWKQKQETDQEENE